MDKHVNTSLPPPVVVLLTPENMLKKIFSLGNYYVFKSFVGRYTLPPKGVLSDYHSGLEYFLQFIGLSDQKYL